MEFQAKVIIVNTHKPLPSKKHQVQYLKTKKKETNENKKIQNKMIF